MTTLKRDGGSAEQSASWPPEKKKKRRSRWANDEEDKLFIPGMPTTLPADATDEQKDQYLLQLQIEESSRRLRSGDLGISANPEERSPSPEPIYNNEGKRMNTREYRTRKALEEDRHEKIQKLLLLNPAYKPPSDYKPPIIRVNDKVMIPQDNHPEINFVGLLIGPRGNTLKTLEKETGAKIIIRGKGSVKEGKIGRKDGQPLPGEDEPLHAYITANDPENVKKAVNKIHEIIKEGIEIPEEKNDLRKQQLRELALLNGTLRDNDSGLQKLRQIAEAETIITNQIICTKCGAAGHIARDCMQKTPAEVTHSQMVASRGFGDLPANTIVGRQDRAKMDSEYMSLMAELGQVSSDTMRSELVSKMPRPLMGDPFTANNGSHASKVGSDPPPPTSSAPTLSADYGYGGRRSRFDEFDNSRNRNNERFDRGSSSRFDKNDSYSNGGRHGGSQFDRNNERPRFDHPPQFDKGPPSRFDQGPPPSRFDQGPPPSRFDQGPPPSNRFDQGPPQSNRFDQGPPPPNRFDQGPPPLPQRFDQESHSSRFDQGPPSQHGRFDRGPPSFDQPPHGSGWSSSAPPQRPASNMMNSNRWGPPAAVAPPPPPIMSPPTAPPPMSGFSAPPPPPSGSWPQPPLNNAPWQQQSSAPAPPWQSQGSYGGNPAAPPPPPPPSSTAGGYSSSSGFGSYLPPPPPPQ